MPRLRRWRSSSRSVSDASTGLIGAAGGGGGTAGIGGGAGIFGVKKDITKLPVLGFAVGYILPEP